MSQISSIDITLFETVNSLWADYVESIGVERAQISVRQALDLQRMQGSSLTLPVLIVETCGMALINHETLRKHMGFSSQDERLVLIASLKNKSLQLIREF